MLGTLPSSPTSTGEEAGGFKRWLPLAQNVLVVGALYEVYQISRGLIPRNGQLAVQHADAVWEWEVRHGLFVEPAWQQFWLTRQHDLGRLHLTPGQVTDFLNTGYLYVHFLGTIAFLIWLFVRRRALFPLVRNIFFVTTGIALAIYILYPLAPPRLTPNLLYYHHHYRFIDTIQEVLNPKLTTSEIGYNPYAAMPSLHFAWSLIVGGTLALTLRPRILRALGLLYPAFMLAVIVISGNHYFADALASTAIVGLATVIALLWRRWLAKVRVDCSPADVPQEKAIERLAVRAPE